MLPEDDRVYGPWPIGGEIDVSVALIPFPNVMIGPGIHNWVC